MTTSDPWVFTRLEKRHDRKQFCCGVAVLDDYLKTRSGQEQRRQVTFTYVLTRGDDPRVWAYYTLSAASVALTDLPEAEAKKLGYDMAPAALIGRLAVDQELQGQGVGKLVLIDALRRLARSDMAIMLIIVDPKDHAAEKFYRRFGFQALSDNEPRMYVPFKAIVNL